MQDSKSSQISKLKQLRSTILINFNCTQYLKITKEINFEKVPQELFDLWYSAETISILNLPNLSINFNSLSQEKLSQMIDDVEKLNLAFKREFNALSPIN